jgi:hypothetical protein
LIDTLKFAKELTGAGLTQEQAEASGLATKADLTRGISRLELQVSEFKAEIYRFLYLQALTVIGLTVGLTVTLIKLLP